MVGKKKTTKKMFCTSLLFRNERVAGIFLPSFDNTNGHPSLSREIIVEIQKSRPLLLSIEALYSCDLFDNNYRSVGILKQIQYY